MHVDTMKRGTCLMVFFRWTRAYIDMWGFSCQQRTTVKIMDNVASVSLGEQHSAAITADGSLYTWGYNLFGQLGNGTTENSSTPIKITIPSEA